MVNNKPRYSTWTPTELVPYFGYRIKEEDLDVELKIIINDGVLDDCSTKDGTCGRVNDKTIIALRNRFYLRRDELPGFPSPPRQSSPPDSPPLPISTKTSTNFATPIINRLDRMTKSRGFRLTMKILGGIITVGGLIKLFFL